MRLLHSSDLHIGADGEGSFTRRWGRGIGDVVRRERVDAVLLAGDTYDSNRVPAEVVEQTVEWFESLDVPVVILPGNHDCYDQRSAYLRPSFARSGRIDARPARTRARMRPRKQTTPLSSPRPRLLRWSICRLFFYISV